MALCWRFAFAYQQSKNPRELVLSSEEYKQSPPGPILPQQYPGMVFQPIAVEICIYSNRRVPFFPVIDNVRVRWKAITRGRL